MPKKPAIPPFRGASNNSSFINAGLPFAPADALENVMPYDATKDRPRIGTRPGTTEYFYGTWGGGSRIQGCGVVARGRTQTGYQLGTATDLVNTNGSTHLQGAITGNVWREDETWGLTAYSYDDATAAGPYSDTGDSGADDTNVNACCLSRDGTKLIIGRSYDDGSGDRVARVTCLNATTLALIWSKRMDDPGIDRFVNAIACSDDWVFVATNHFLRVFRLSDGSNPPAPSKSVYGFNGWSSEAIDVKVTASGTTLYGLFLGSTSGATLASGCVVSTGIYASHFRSGVMKFTIATRAAIVAATATEVLTQAVLGTQIGPSNRYYEGSGTSRHNYCRFSERMPWGPRGLKPTALALTPDGGFVVTHANAAWGPDSTNTHTIAGGYGFDDYLPPDGSAGYHNLTKFDANGAYQWRQDGDSIRTEDSGGGNLCDLLDPTAVCIAVDDAGNIYTGGRKTAPGDCAYAWDSTGNYLWSLTLGGTVRALLVMPGSQAVIAGGDRNDIWAGSGGDYAHLWELRQLDGSVIRAQELGSVSTLGLAGNDDNDLWQVTDKL